MALSYQVKETSLLWLSLSKILSKLFILQVFLPVSAQCPFYLAGIAIGATVLVPRGKTGSLCMRTRTNGPLRGTESWRMAIILLALKRRLVS